MSEATLRVSTAEGPAFDLPVIARIEINYYRDGGPLWPHSIPGRAGDPPRG